MANDPSKSGLPEYANPMAGRSDWWSPDYLKYLSDVGTGKIKTGADTIKSAQAPAQNPLAQTMYNQSLKRATDYNKNLPAYSDALYNQAEGQASQQLQGQNRATRNSFNSRGLLNSGGEAGAEANNKSQTKQSLYNTRASINQGLLNNAQQLEGNAFQQASYLSQPGAQTAQGDLQKLQSDIAANESDQQLQSQMFGSIAGGVGAIGGAGLAGLMYNNGQAAPTNYGAAGAVPANPYGVYSGGMNLPGATTRYAPVDYGMGGGPTYGRF